ncbi:MAG: hypothetical protein GY841_14180 [FCB group bacterium]|nr:hypothetical protein [FCB group bacterium]
MEKTVIKYKDLGDRVEILSIKNIATRKQLLKKYNQKLIDEYFSKVPYYAGSNIRDYFQVNTSGLIYKVNKNISKKHFLEIISIMKKAGNRLGKLIKEYKENQIKVIKI